MKIGVIFADTQEYLPFINHYENANVQKKIVAQMEVSQYKTDDGNEIIAIHSGIGKVNAANAAAVLIYLYGADAVLNAGLSGAVSKLRREDIVAGTSYIECDFDLTAIGYDLGVKADGEEYIHKADEKLLSCAQNVKCADVKLGKLGTGDIFLSDSKKKNMYKELFDICAFDMESAAIAAVCSKNGTAFLSVRKISDDADDASKEDYREMNNRQEVVLSQIILEIVDQIINTK